MKKPNRKHRRMSQIKRQWKKLTIAAVMALGVTAALLTFAAEKPVAVIEAENMTVVSGQKVEVISGLNKTHTSEGSILLYFSNGTAEKTVSTPAVNRIVVKARGGMPCPSPSGWPQMVVRVDGTQVLSATVDQLGWKHFPVKNLNLPAGNHTVQVSFTNDYFEPRDAFSTSPPKPLTCDRNLRVDRINFYAATSPTPTPTVSATPTPRPSETATPQPNPTATPITDWRAPRSTPLSDAVAASRVTPRPENRPENTAANQYSPTDAELSSFHNASYGAGPNAGTRADAYNPLLKYVSGRYTGTTDQIIQWAAHKWGIPEDIMRAQAVNESTWRQGARGDRRDGVNASLYPAVSRIDSDSVYESLGLLQIKWRPDGSLNPGSEPLRWKSTAFNADYSAANVRYYYDGYCSWCKPGYTAGQAWESIGAHYEPSPWRNSGMMTYISHIQDILNARTWEQF